MLNITDHLYLLEEELDTALKAIPELKAQIAHLNEEIYTILSKVSPISLLMRELEKLTNGVDARHSAASHRGES